MDTLEQSLINKSKAQELADSITRYIGNISAPIQLVSTVPGETRIEFRVPPSAQDVTYLLNQGFVIKNRIATLINKPCVA